MRKQSTFTNKGRRQSSIQVVVTESELQALEEISKAENLKRALNDIENDTGYTLH